MSRLEGSTLKPGSFLISDQSGPLTVALLAGCEATARRLLGAARDAGADLATISVEMIEPALDQVGAMWARGEISIAEEHLATGLLARALAYACGSEPPKAPGAPRIVLSCPAGEFHELGLKIASEVARESGWDVEVLGANVPRSALARFVAQRRPQALGISVALAGHLPECAATVQECRTAAPDTTVLVGGRAFRFDPDLAPLVRADVVLTGVLDLRDWLRKNAGSLSADPSPSAPKVLPPPPARPVRFPGNR